MADTIKGAPMPYRVTGSGEPLLLIHGLGESSEAWAYQQALSLDYCLITPDLRGHGSNTNVKNVDIAHMAADCLLLLDKLQKEDPRMGKVHILGYSMGGLVAQELFKIAPERFRSIILSNTFHWTPPGVSDLVSFWRLWSAEYLTKEQRRSLTASTGLYKPDEETRERFYSVYNPNAEGYLQAVKNIRRVDNRDLLKGIHCPALVIGSDNDYVTPRWFQKEMVKLIPGAVHVEFKNAGHLVKFEYPEHYFEVVRDFLGGRYATTTDRIYQPGPENGRGETHFGVDCLAQGE